MKFLKIKMVFIFIFSLLSITSYAATTPAFDQIVFFGDSLSDNGNLYHLDIGFLPKSPPYFQGRFSNGPVWSELLANNFLEKNITSSNYAVGGETANFYSAASSLLQFDLNMSIYDYLLNNTLQEKSHTLFIIWIGGNDYLGTAVVDEEQYTKAVVNQIQESVERLILRGGKYILLLNLPDLGKIPYAKLNGSEKLTHLTQLHNAKLQTAVAEVQANNPDVKIRLFDMNSLFTDLMAQPDVYNTKYNLHLSNLTEACWTGGNTLKVQEQSNMTRSLENSFNQNAINGLVGNALVKKMNFITMAKTIQANPSLHTAYQVGTGATVPCADPDAYLFWDSVHPSRMTHSVISKVMTDYINENFQ
jgi:phospholipase/lecithinase/hemolysin